MPLLRDRGFRLQRWRQESLDAEAGAAAARAFATGESLAREALANFAGWLYANADVRETGNSVKRVERLLEETAGRVELQTMAEYQVYGARMEVAFRQEELRQAQAALENAYHALAALLGRLPEPFTDGPHTARMVVRCATGDVSRLLERAAPRGE